MRQRRLQKVSYAFGLGLAAFMLLAGAGWGSAQVSSDLFRHVTEAELVRHHCLRAEAETTRLAALADSMAEQVDPIVEAAPYLGVELSRPDLSVAEDKAVQLTRALCRAKSLEAALEVVTEWNGFASNLQAYLAGVGNDWGPAWAERQRELAGQQTPVLVEQLQGKVAAWQKEIDDYAAVEAGRATDRLAAELAENPLPSGAARNFLEVRREQLELEVQAKVNDFREERLQLWHAAARKRFPALDYPEKAGMAAFADELNGLPNRIRASWQLGAPVRAKTEQAAADSLLTLVTRAVDTELSDSVRALRQGSRPEIVDMVVGLQAKRDQFDSRLRQALERFDWATVNAELVQFSDWWQQQRRAGEQLVFSTGRLCLQLSEQEEAWAIELAAANEAVNELMIGCQGVDTAVCWAALSVSAHLNAAQRQLAAMRSTLDEMSTTCASDSGSPASTTDTIVLKQALDRLLASRGAILQANDLLAWEIELNTADREFTYSELCERELPRMDYHRQQADQVIARWHSDFAECTADAAGESVSGGLKADSPNCQRLLPRQSEIRNIISRMGASADRRGELAEYCQQNSVNLDGVLLRLARYWDDFDKWDATAGEILRGYREPTEFAAVCQMTNTLMGPRTRQLGRTFAELWQHRARLEQVRTDCATDGLQVGCSEMRKAEESHAKTNGKLQEFKDAFWGADQLCRRFADRAEVDKLVNFLNTARSTGQRAWSMSLSNKYLYDKVDESLR